MKNKFITKWGCRIKLNKSNEGVIWSQIHHFKKDEFACGCGCGLNNIDLKLVMRLEKARRNLTIPFIISSACRCSNHNKSVGGSESSSHIKGLAVDILIDSSSSRYKIIQSLLDNGFNRLGVYKNFVHVDIDSSKTQGVIWYM